MNSLETMNVMLVDDDEYIRSSMEFYFKRKTGSFKAVESAERGLLSLEKERWDILITDYRLPGMNGIDLLEIVKREHPDIMTVLITAFGHPDMASRAIRIGNDDFIQKPFTAHLVKESLQWLIEKRRRGMRSASLNGKEFTGAAIAPLSPGKGFRPACGSPR